MMFEEAIKREAKKVRFFCERTGYAESKVYQWFRRGVPAKEVLNIERVCLASGFEISRHEISPEYYPLDGCYSTDTEEQRRVLEKQKLIKKLKSEIQQLESCE